MAYAFVERTRNLAILFGSLFLALLGPCLSIIALTAITFVVYVFFTEVYPMLFHTYSPSICYVLTAVGIYLAFNIYFNYLACSFVGPGHAPKDLSLDVRDYLIHDPQVIDTGRQYRYCKICDVVKPMRTHHCSICKKCVLKMDHHCPWVNNCVGYRNHRYFLLFLFHLCSGCIFFLASSYENASALLTGSAINSDSDNNGIAMYLFAGILAFAACIAASLFFIWSTFLALTNQTTIEFYGNFLDKIDNPYNMGVWNNLEEVFGKFSFAWFLPSLRPPPGDGYLYPLNQGRGRVLPQMAAGDRNV